MGSPAGGLVEGLLDLDLFVGLDDITDLDIVIAFDIQTTVLTHDDLLSVVLISLEGAELTSVLDDTITDETDLYSISYSFNKKFIISI